MKQPVFLIGLAVIILLCSACVSRTYSSGVSGDEVTETKLLWIWQDEYHNK